VTTTSERPSGSRIQIAARQSRDRALARLLGLPAPTTGYTVERGVRVPMRDGVDLVADHYAPVPADGTDAADAAGTLLVRGPYGRGFPFSTLYARPYAARGYHVVVQSVRGTFGSGGVFEPMTREVADGADTVEWLRRQSWFTGRFATIGPSYLGFTQWALLMDPPAELAAAVIAVGPHDFSASIWGTGAFKLTDSLGWADVVANQEQGRLGTLRWAAGARRRLARATLGLPLGESARSLLGTGAQWYESWLEHHDPGDPFWEPSRLGAALDRASVPVLLISGWQDLFLEQTLAQYRHLRGRGVDVALTVGKWTHMQVTSTGAGHVTRESLEWLDRNLAGAPGGPARDPVHVFVTGDGWVGLPDWPPSTSPRVLHLQPGGVLTDAAPSGEARPSRFTYDPAKPTPIVGGALLASEGGYRDDSRLARRPDVLSFTGDTLASDLYAVGNPVVELSHAADIPHVDLFVRLSEVDPRGRSHNVSDGYRRLTAAPEPGPVRVELDAVAHRFRAGSRIRLLIAGGAHPRFSRNLGTEEAPITGRRLVAATHTVHYGPSRLVLPMTPGRPSADRAAHPVGDPA
jgi:putative CocE/NonD family hydrolase